MINAHMKMHLEFKIQKLGSAFISRIIEQMEDVDSFLKDNVAAWTPITLAADANWVVTLGVGNIDDNLPKGEIKDCYYVLVVRHNNTDEKWMDLEIRRDRALDQVLIDNKPRANLSNPTTHVDYSVLLAMIEELTTVISTTDLTGGTILFTKKEKPVTP